MLVVGHSFKIHTRHDFCSPSVKAHVYFHRSGNCSCASSSLLLQCRCCLAQLTPLERVKVHLALAQSVVTLYQLHRRLDAANLDKHPIQKELVRAAHGIMANSSCNSPCTASVYQRLYLSCFACGKFSQSHALCMRMAEHVYGSHS
jgi:hypothetical protein